METDTVSETLCSLEYEAMNKAPKPSGSENQVYVFTDGKIYSFFVQDGPVQMFCKFRRHLKKVGIKIKKIPSLRSLLVIGVIYKLKRENFVWI
jgi:hypothetical protein